MVKLYDHRGNEVDTSVLQEAQSDRQEARIGMLYREYAGHPSRGLTPARLAHILEDAERGQIKAQCELFEDMEEKDAHIFSELSKRKRALLGLDWRIEPPRNASAAEKKYAEQLTEMIQDIENFEDVLLDMADAIGKGFANLEYEWELLGREWMPKEIIHRPQSWFMLNPDDQNELRLRDNSGRGAELQPFGWIQHVHKAKSGYIARAGLHRILAWPFLFKNFSVRDLAEFLEIYGLPLRLGKYPSGATKEEKATLLRAVMQIGHAAAGIIPEGMAIEFQEAAKGAADPYQAMMDWCEASQSKAILGGTLTTTAANTGLGSNLGDVHNEVRHDLRDSDTIQIGSTLSRDLVYPLCVLNGIRVENRRRMYRFKFDVQEPEDFVAFSQALPELVKSGVRIPVSYPNDKLGIPQPGEGEAVLQLSEAQPEKPAIAQKTVALKVQSDISGGERDHSAYPDQQALDVALESIAPEQYRDQAVAALKPAVSMVMASADYSEVYDHLAESFPAMDTADLEETLARILFVADVWGRLSSEL